MYCPTCRSEFRPGFSRCATCNTELVAALPSADVFASAEAMAEALTDRELSPVAAGTYASVLGAQEILRQVRVLCTLATESGEVDAGLHQKFLLLVAEADLERARAALREQWEKGLTSEGLETVASGQTAIDAERCPACGVAIPPSAAECPECGLFVGAAEDDA